MIVSLAGRDPLDGFVDWICPTPRLQGLGGLNGSQARRFLPGLDIYARYRLQCRFPQDDPLQLFGKF